MAKSMKPYGILTQHREIFEKCSILFKVKSKIPDYEPENARILTTGIPCSISRIDV
jgi:hypothetical protein